LKIFIFVERIEDMEIRIEWSELSERQLKDSFDYYSLEVSPKIANC